MRADEPLRAAVHAELIRVTRAGGTITYGDLAGASARTLIARPTGAGSSI